LAYPSPQLGARHDANPAVLPLHRAVSTPEDSQVSPALVFTLLSPHTARVQSTLHRAVSPPMPAPSPSQSSPACTHPSPQAGAVHVLVQVSVLSALPSSQASPSAALG
jgi:hypothetical protein